jgi:hypothetical protein
MAVNLGKGGGGGKGFKIGMSMSGHSTFKRALEDIGPKVNSIAEKLADRKADRIVERAKRLCPDDPETGGTDLRESIRRSKLANKDGKVSVLLQAGGDMLAQLPSERGKKSPGAYAIVVHEDTTMRHPHGGQAKFLEQPWLEEQGSAVAELAAAVKG